MRAPASDRPILRYGAMSRRAALVGGALAATAAVAGCGEKSGDAAKGDIGIGADEGAKVTVVEYASVTCAHCAAWQQEVWPAFKAKYVDTKKVRYVFREFLTAMPDVGAAGFLIARCAGEEKYLDVVHAIMASQAEWQTGVPPRTTLFRVAGGAGLSEAQTQECIRDPEALKALEARVKTAIDSGVNGTPTFMVNGTKVADSSLDSLSAAIDAALAKA